MPGFYISNLKSNINLNNHENCECEKGLINNDKYIIKRNTISKFLDDKIFYEDVEHIIITEGVILNKKHLIKKYNKPDFISTVKEMCNNNETFFNEFRGSFSGAIYYKHLDTWIIYTNHIGDKALFYYNSNADFIIGSQLNYIKDTMNELKIQMTLDKKAVNYMLTYAFMGGDNTYANEIKRLEPGSYIKIEHGKISITNYFKFSCNMYDLSDKTENEIVDLLDEKFRKAIALEYDKDLEYGYRHLADLSGGLDSRMNVWVARNLGYKNLLNITYCQSNYLDKIIAKQISEYLKNELIFKTLDDASFIYDIDEIVSMNYGLSYYAGITGGKRLLNNINIKQFGVEHTGQAGDVVISTFMKTKEEKNDKVLSGAYSYKLIEKLDMDDMKKYENKEIYLIYIRLFNGALCTHLIRQNYTEVASPFLDIDFFNFCLSIPIGFRINHKIYKKWIIEKYPEAANFKWEKIGSKITDSKIKVTFNRVKSKLIRIFGGNSNKNSMNPFDYWYQNDKVIYNFINQYFCDNIDNSKIDDELRNSITYLFNEGTTIEKLQALTVLSAVKYYFGA